MENSEFFLPESTPPFSRRRRRNANNPVPVSGNLPRTPLLNSGQYGEEPLEVPFEIPVFNFPINTPNVPSVNNQSPNYEYSSEELYGSPLDPNAPFEEDYNNRRRDFFNSALTNPAKEKEEKDPLYSKNDWVIAGLEGASVISGRARGLQQEQAQANLMREVGQRPTYYAGYYDNMNRTTIGRNQGLITASHGARIPSTATGLENALVEKGEYLVYPDGKFREVGGEKHNSRIVNGQEVGGTETILPEGTMVFSEKLKVPGTKKSFSNMAKSLSGKIEDYMEKMNKVGLAKVDKDTAQLMFTKTVKSLNELFELQQSVNGNHGEDYVDTVDPDTGESGEMAIAGNGMIKYGDGGGTGQAKKKTPQPNPAQGYLEIYERAKADKDVKVQAILKDLLKKEGLDISNEDSLKESLKKADKINAFILGVDEYERAMYSDQESPFRNPKMDKTKGDEFRKKVIEEYLGSNLFKTLNIDPTELSIFSNNSIEKNPIDGTYRVKQNIKNAKQLFNEPEVGSFQGIYKAGYLFNKQFKDNPNYALNFVPTGVSDQTLDGKPISPVDRWMGNTTIRQGVKPIVNAPEYEEPESEETPAVQTSPGNQYTPAAPVRPAKYTPRPFDNKQILSNVLAMSQNVAPYAIPEIQDIRVTPYETYIDPAVQDQYTAAMAGSSYGADPNAMFINATANVLKLQADKRNQDANIDYQTRMKNAEFERQADQFNTTSLGNVNNNLLNVAKSNKAENDINALQNMVEKYQTYQTNEARTAMNFPLLSPGYDFDARTLEYSLVPGYNEAMMGNLNSTLMNQEGFRMPTYQEYMSLARQQQEAEAKKKKAASKTNPNNEE